MTIPTESYSSSGVVSPAGYAEAVTPHDTNQLTAFTRGVYIGVGGDMKVVMAGSGATVTFVGIPTGTLLPIRVSLIYATDTTASSIVALW